jgi:hypothetical protein
VRILCLSGKAESGKSTAAEFIKCELAKQEYIAIVMSFANKVKYYAEKYFGWNGIKDECGRKLLQDIGMIARKVNPNFWVEEILDFLRVFGSNFDYIIIDDCRFENEINIFKDEGYDVTAVRIERPGHENKLTEEQRKHISENALNDYNFDLWISAVDKCGLYNECLELIL